MSNGELFRGEQLRLARLAFGYSLDEVGVMVGATRQFIHQLEVEAKAPSRDLVTKLAGALGVTPRFFSASLRSSVRPEQCHFRKQATTPASITSQVLARGSILDALAEELDKRLELPSVNFPESTVRSLDDVEAAAEAAREQWGLGSFGPITNMMRVVENAGAIVTYFAGISDRVDALSMDRKRPIIVRSEAKQSVCRLSFLAAFSDEQINVELDRIRRARFLPSFPTKEAALWERARPLIGLPTMCSGSGYATHATTRMAWMSCGPACAIQPIHCGG